MASASSAIQAQTPRIEHSSTFTVTKSTKGSGGVQRGDLAEVIDQLGEVIDHLGALIVDEKVRIGSGAVHVVLNGAVVGCDAIQLIPVRTPIAPFAARTAS